jgi:putative transcriptional regulator
MNKINYFNQHFLIAMPGLDDANFSKAVVFIEEHNEEGAVGIIINKPLEIQLAAVFDHLNITAPIKSIAHRPVLLGGPVGQEQGFVLHSEHENDSDENIIHLSSSKDILSQIANGEGPARFQVALGYSGWEAGQLEEEISQNDWLVIKATASILFHTPIAKRWPASIQSLGIDATQLSDQSGHA